MFIDDLNLTNDDREYEFIYCNICGEQIELGEELTDRLEATFYEVKHQNEVRKVSSCPIS